MLLKKKTLFKAGNEDDYQVGQIIERPEGQDVIIALLKTEIVGMNTKIDVLVQDVNVADPLGVFYNYNLPMTQTKKYYLSSPARILQVGDTVSGVAKGVQGIERLYAKVAGIEMCERHGQMLIMRYKLAWIKPWSRRQVDQAVFKHKTQNFNLLNGTQTQKSSAPQGHLSLVK